jgi:hypothetical protein
MNSLLREEAKKRSGNCRAWDGKIFPLTF